MKNSVFGDKNGLSSSHRRELIKSMGAAAGLALALPGSRVFAASQLTRQADATAVAIGYWQQGSVASDNPADVLADGGSLVPVPGSYELRILGVQSEISLALDAHYAGGARHRFWQAWKEGGLLQRSQTTAIRWWAGNGSPLPLDVSLPGGSASTSVAARPGVYVLAIGSGAQRPPEWRDLALRPRIAGSSDLQLLSRVSGKAVKFPYALFAVKQIAV